MASRDELFEKIQKNSRQFREELAYIREDERRSDVAKKEDIKTLYDRAATKHADLEAQYRSDLEARLDKNRREALAFPKVSKDPGMDLLVRRDAIYRASRPLDSRGLGDLLELARLGDDEVLAVATLRRTYELTDENTVGAFLTNYPDRAPAWNLFMATAEEYNMLEAEGISSLVGAFPPEQPTEIGGSPFTRRGTACGLSDVEATLDRIASSFATSQAPPEPAESASEESAS